MKHPPFEQREKFIECSLKSDMFRDFSHWILTDTAASRWQSAVNSAKCGKLGGGVLALVSELERMRPHNQDLKELAQIISAVQHRK